jgi:hypothetical protein
MAGAQFATKDHSSPVAPTIDAAPPIRRSGLLVGAANDPAEQDADRVAAAVISRLREGSELTALDGPEHQGHHHGAEPTVSRSVATTEAPVVGMAGGELDGALSSRIESRRGAGQTLAGPIRSTMESAFGRGLGDVRVHTDGESAKLNRSISAKAFTTGNDIFFGAGQYSPDTEAGQHTLAHELAHVAQQGGGAHRMVHRVWDMTAPVIPWANTQTVGTISSGQPVYFLADGTGDRIVVKAENNPVGLQTMAEAMHVPLSQVKSVKHRSMSGAETTTVKDMVTDPALQDRVTFAKLGATKRAGSTAGALAAGMIALDPTLTPDTMTDVQWGEEFTRYQLRGADSPASTFPFMVMSVAEGTRAADVSAEQETSGETGLKSSRMRRLMQDAKHLRALGQLTAVDLFLGNSDRALMGNMGNWFYDPDSAAMTAIDHVDAAMRNSFDLTKQAPADIAALLKPIGNGQLGKSARESVRLISYGMLDAGDADAVKWLKHDTNVGIYAEEMFEQGMIAGKKLLIKTFSATKFTVGGSKARAVKKEMKAAAKAGRETDSGQSDNVYYDILKARIAWLKKN